MTDKVVRKPSVTLHYFLLGIYMIPCMVIFGIGLLLCLTIVGIAPGVILMGGAAVPIAAETNRYIKKRTAWESTPEGAEKFRTGRGKRNQVYEKLLDDLVYEYDPEQDKMVPIEKPWVED